MLSSMPMHWWMDVPTRLKKAAMMVGRAKGNRPNSPVWMNMFGYLSAG